MGESLGNDVAIVTGVGRGIGRAIALSLAAEGAAIGVFARTDEEITATVAQISEAGDRGLALSVDVRDNVAVRWWAVLMTRPSSRQRRKYIAVVHNLGFMWRAIDE